MTRLVDLPALGPLTDTSRLAGANAGAGTFTMAQMRADLSGDVVNVAWFGAKGDNVADDTAAAQAAIATGKSVFFPGRHKITGNLTSTTSGQYLIGRSPSTGGSELLFSNGGDSITFGSLIAPLDGVGVRDLRISGANKSGGNLIRMVRVSRSRISNVVLANPWSGIELYGFTDVSLTDVIVAGVRGDADAWALRVTGDDTYRWNVLQLRNFGSSPDNTARVGRPTGMVVDGPGASIYCYQVRAVRMGRGVWVKPPIAPNVGIIEFIVAHSIDSDFSEYEAMRLEYGDSYWLQNAYMHGSTLAQNLYVGPNATNVQITGGVCSGAFLEGMEIAGKEVGISNLAIARNSVAGNGTYNGAKVAASAANVRFNGCIIGRRNNLSGLQKYGIGVDVAATNVLVSGCDMTGNATGPIEDTAGVASLAGNLGPTRELQAPGTTLLDLGNQGQTMFRVGNSSAGTYVNYLRAAGGVAGQPALLMAEGTDTNINIRILPKGDGGIVLGPRFASADAPITGYMTVLDENNVPRKLAIIG